MGFKTRHRAEESAEERKYGLKTLHTALTEPHRAAESEEERNTDSKRFTEPHNAP